MSWVVYMYVTNVIPALTPSHMAVLVRGLTTADTEIVSYDF